MRSDREAKRVLKAFGKEAYKERIKYVDSFLPEKTSFIKSINYRHTLRRVAMVALMVILIMALAVSVYAAVMHYLNYTRVEHPTNDKYVPNSEATDTNPEGIFFEPTYVSEGYELDSEKYDELFDEKEWQYIKSDSKILVIRESHSNPYFNVDNERSDKDIINVGNIEVVVYNSDGKKMCLFQYENTVINIIGQISNDEIEQIIRGLNLPE